MVCEFTGPVKYEVKEIGNGNIELHLLSVRVGEKFFLPKLPSQIKILTSVEAFREGDEHIVMEIRGTEPLYAKATELKGQTWRLALDMSKLSEKPTEPAQPEHPAQLDTISTNKPNSKPKHDDGPEYIPGDRPMETKLADQHETTPETHKEAPQPEVHEESHDLAQQSEDPHEGAHENQSSHEVPETETLASADSLKALEVLSEFYAMMGDSETAKEYASMFLERKGYTSPHKVEENTANIPWWMIGAIAFVAGLIGGVIGGKIKMPSMKFKLPGLKLPKLKFGKKDKSKDAAEELEDDIASLDRAVASEKKITPKPPKEEPKKPEPPKDVKEEPKAAPAPEPATPAELEPVTENVEAAMKESLMDRRVKRVLELSAEKKSLAEIAQELDMGQDEVKLIIDLNS